MASTGKNYKTQTKLRLAMLDNGYVPLPNHDKRCMVKSWSTITVDREAIKDWDSKLIYRATGLRLEPGLCAIDVDVNDGDFVEELWGRATQAVPLLEKALIRFGKGDKEMWLVNVEPSFGYITSTTHVRPGEDPEGEEPDTHRIECFGGEHGRQFGVYGAHTVGERGETEIAYEWADSEGPAEVPRDSLPLLQKEDVLEIVNIANEMFDEFDWPRVRKIKAGEIVQQLVYDLTEEMVFECNDGVDRTLDELAQFAETGRSPRCSASWLEGPQAKNRTRCLVTLSHDGQPCVFETANAQNHLPIEAEPEDPGAKMQSFKEKLESAGYTLPDEIDDAPDAFKEAVFEMLECYAFNPSRTRPVLPIYGEEEQSASVTNMKAYYASRSYVKIGPRGGEKQVNPVDVWVKHPDRQNVDSYRFLPNRGPGVHIEADGATVINSYREPQKLFVPVDPGLQHRYRSIWNDLIRHLLPDSEERAWFMDWIAHKYQHLNVPGVGVLMVAKTHGVGRGSLFEMLQQVFGMQYVKPISASQLLGENSQSQYTDWQVRALIATVDEVLPDGDDGSAMAWKRRKAYEKLKERIDPKAHRVEVIRKGLPNYEDFTYTSYLLATNHPNAIPLDEKDRRIAVLTNSNEDLINAPGRLYERVNEVRDPQIDPLFIAVVRDMLARHKVSEDFSPYVAPAFKGRELMIEDNKTAFDEIVDDVLENLPCDWVTVGAFHKRVEREMTKHQMKGEVTNWRNLSTDILRNRWYSIGKTNVSTEKYRTNVYVRTPYAETELKEASLEDRGDQFAMLNDVEAKPSVETIAARAGIRQVK